MSYLLTRVRDVEGGEDVEDCWYDLVAGTGRYYCRASYSIENNGCKAAMYTYIERRAVCKEVFYGVTRECGRCGMGSEGPLPVRVHVSGFKKFHGVPNNPTDTIVSNLEEYLKRRGVPLPGGITIATCNVIEAAGEAALPLLNQIIGDPSHPEDPFAAADDQVVWLHFGANGGTSKFFIECQAVNEATFRCPDERGWQPQVQLPIVPEDGGISHTRQSTCSIETIVKYLKKRGFDVAISDDADQFVCNYLYYHSLRLASEKGYKSLFVHVPLFSRIDEDTQMEFAASLLEALALTQ
ncbi:hypothetical protein Sjap_016124 [Stephania japonica]|uniref:Pyrrolidone-carboxylate peptidase n=1 Tax=Stephania japonica TaxID=461633 RepID=A0AAP0IKP9_9MAGN